MCFEVKKTEMASKTFHLPLDLLTRLGTLAQQEGVSLNNLVGQCCEYALANLPGSSSNPDTQNSGGTL